MKTVIYTQRVEIIESYNERRDCADQRIADFIHSCGYIPAAVPNKPEVINGIIESIRPIGIVLTGGNSLVKYGGNAPERDAMDQGFIAAGIQKKIPIYGFCRGMQSILDYFENSLVEVKGHAGQRHKLIGKNNGMEVNSYHNWACLKLKPDCGLTIINTSEDGVIEEVQHDSLAIAATMWHPERENMFSESDKNRMKSLFGGE